MSHFFLFIRNFHGIVPVATERSNCSCVGHLWLALQRYSIEYKSLVTLIDCMFEAVRSLHSKIQGLSRPVMIVSKLDTIEFIFK